jgi:ubiquinone/menaquinone biosynthesis C-methylase UbiE
MKSFLRKIKNLAYKVLGSKIEEIYWRFRHIFNKDWAEKYVSEDSLNSPPRQLLINSVSKYAPFDSVFEVGCASGPNLYLLAKKFPQAKIYGSDISKEAINFGKRYFEEQKIKNVEFFHNQAEKSFKNFADKSIDIIFSDATLIYLDQKKITATIKEMFRVGRKALIFVEWHTELPSSIFDDHWIHNYRNLLTKFISSEKIKFTKIPENILAGNWAKYGYIIEVNLEK